MKRDLGLLLLRLGAGVTLMAHGYPKLFGGPEKEPPQPVAEALGPNFAPAVKQGGPESFAQMLAQMGVPEPQVAAVLAGLAEFGGGLGLVLGLGTRPAGLVASARDYRFFPSSAIPMPENPHCSIHLHIARCRLRIVKRNVERDYP